MSKLFPFSPSVEGKPLVKKIVHFVDLSCCVCMYVCMCVCMHVLVVRFLERVVSIALTLFSFSIFSHFYWNNLLFFFFSRLHNNNLSFTASECVDFFSISNLNSNCILIIMHTLNCLYFMNYS